MKYSIKAFGANVRRARQSLGFTQRELAELIGCNHSHICHIETYSSYENRRSPCVSIDLVFLLVTELGLTMEEAFTNA